MSGATEKSDDLDPRLVPWLADVTGTDQLSITRRTGGASRAGYAVDARVDAGTVEELWLRTDPGFGPQSDTLYSLHREAAVYRALGPTSMRVADLVAVHPELPAFLLRRVRGDSRFAQIDDPDARAAIAGEFMDQLATLHSLEPLALDLPELGQPGRVRRHVLDEIIEWEEQYRAAGGGVPAISLAFAWLRANLPEDDDSPVVLVQGDTGPGNFMFVGDRLAAITDWELAHWGDRHDDLAWVLVRNTLEPLPDIDSSFRDYERSTGLRIEMDRLRYFRILAQCRCTIGTLAGLRSGDERGEIAWQLIFNTLHTRLLAEALAEETQVDPPPRLVVPDEPGEHSWAFDVALADLRDVVTPAVADDFATTRAKGVARLLKYLREVDRMGPQLVEDELREIGELVGGDVGDVATARKELCAAIEGGEATFVDAVGYCLNQSARDGALVGPAMGSLTGRHLAMYGGSQYHNGEGGPPGAIE